MEPKYEKKLETLNKLHSDVVYGYHPALNLVQDIISYTEFVKFLEQKNLMEDYSDDRMCDERIIR
jgi:mannitol-1-phosphate/altronate dehydrogenase